MIIGKRLKTLRTEKKLSQGDIEKRSRLLRCYISRVENGHTVPSVGTLERLARAIDVPLYRLFFEGMEPPKAHPRVIAEYDNERRWGASGRNAGFINDLRHLVGKMDQRQRDLVLYVATKVAQKQRQ